MKATFDRQQLLTACQVAMMAVPGKDIKPVLKNFKLTAQAGHQCSLIATDLEIGVGVSVQDAEVEEPGEALIPASRLLDIVRESKVERLLLDANPGGTTVTGVDSSLEFELPGEDPSLFPDFPDAADKRYHSVQAGVLRDLVRRTSFAAADESARYSLAGVMWELYPDQFRLVATDGRRLAVAEAPTESYGSSAHSTEGQTPVVPSKAVALLEKCLSGDPEMEVLVTFRPNEALFRTPTAVIYSRLVEGRFPDWRLVLPKESGEPVTLDPATFYRAVRQAAVMVDDESPKVTFDFTPGKFTPGKLVLSARGVLAGRSHVELTIDYAGDAVSVVMNPEYVTDLLKALPQEAGLTVELAGAVRPVVFRSGDHHSYVVMPMT